MRIFETAGQVCGLLLVCALASVLPADAASLQTLSGATSVTLEELIELASSDHPPVIIDSRISANYERGHLQDAVNIVDVEMTAEILEQIVGRSEEVLFYCSGAECTRSSNAVTKAVEWGWTKVYWFPGGIAEWNKNNLPLAR